MLDTIGRIPLVDVGGIVIVGQGVKVWEGADGGGPDVGGIITSYVGFNRGKLQNQAADTGAIEWTDGVNPVESLVRAM